MCLPSPHDFEMYKAESEVKSVIKSTLTEKGSNQNFHENFNENVFFPSKFSCKPKNS